MAGFGSETLVSTAVCVFVGHFHFQIGKNGSQQVE